MHPGPIFTLFHRGIRFASVNENTSKKIRPEAMVQLSQVLKRIIYHMGLYRANGIPFKFTKLDAKDGFWRKTVADEYAWNFCYVLPSLKPTISLDDVEIVVPNSLQMGWCKSPPLFCSGSEMARDLMEKLRTMELPPRNFEAITMEQFPLVDTYNTPYEKVTLSEVYVDNFIAMSNDLRHQYLLHTSRAMLHGIHAIFLPPAVTGHNSFDPIAEAKLCKGEGMWDITKELLGWEFDGHEGTIRLPLLKCKNICTLLRKIFKKKRITLNLFQKIAACCLWLAKWSESFHLD